MDCGLSRPNKNLCKDMVFMQNTFCDKNWEIRELWLWLQMLSCNCDYMWTFVKVIYEKFYMIYIVIRDQAEDQRLVKEEDSTYTP